jgi:type IV pilus assembly protein PilA
MRKQRGFTLIELLVVIAIIGILATLVITQLSGAQTRARNSNAKSDVSEMGKAVETWKTTNNTENAVDAVTTAAGVTWAGTRLNGGGTTSVCTANTTAADEICGGWGTLFNQASGAYPVRVSKSPSTSHVYGYATSTANAAPAMGTANSANYCVGTSTVAPSGGTESAFWVANGVSANGTSGANQRTITYTAGVCS